MDYLRRKWRGYKHRSLLNATKENTKLFSLAGNKYVAKCIDVYDGDSITVVFKFNGKYQQFKIRMMGYDTPEIRSKNLEEKEYGKRAKKALEDKILNKIINLECHEFDKYGRLLATVYIDGNDVNQYMINERYGYPYTGETKMTFEELKLWYGEL